jgi:hypothetical protein
MGVSCVGVSSSVWGFDPNLSNHQLEMGFMHTHTQTNTPKPNFIRVPKMASRSEGIIYKVRSCDLVRFIRGLSLRQKVALVIAYYFVLAALAASSQKNCRCMMT